MAEKTGLTLRKNEIASEIPIGLQYFTAVDDIIGSTPPQTKSTTTFVPTSLKNRQLQ
jgi:hypothetical protein